VKAANASDSEEAILQSEGDSNLSRHRLAWQESYLDQETKDLLAADREHFFRQSLSTPCLNVLRGAQGSLLLDNQGRTILDFHGNSVHQVGYGHPQVVRAIEQQLRTLPFCPRRYTNVPAIELAARLAELAPGSDNKVLFTPGGTGAVGMALKLARITTGRFKTLSMWESFHGASLDAISVGGEALFRRHIGPLLPGTEHVPPADPYRCLWRADGDCGCCDLLCARYIEYVLEQEGDVAAILAEPMRCTRINPPPQGYWQRIRQACDRHGTLLIFDETALCLGRTGTMFACEHEEVVPDILTLGKGLGGGIFPLAAMVARGDLDCAPDKALGHYTHEKNPVACAAALATLNVIVAEGLLEKSRLLGQHAVQRLMSFKQQFSLIGDVRGRGLLFGADLVLDQRQKIPALDAEDRLLYHCLEEGLSFKVSHGSFLTLTPPLNIERQDLDRSLDIIENGLHLLAEHPREQRRCQSENSF
jgi:4-aminobutyrate aminotransferase